MREYQIARWDMHHIEGTKFYCVYEVVDLKSNRSVLVTNWGSGLPDPHRPTSNVSGSIKVSPIMPCRSVYNERDKILGNKVKRGYGLMGAPLIVEIDTLSVFVASLTFMWGDRVTDVLSYEADRDRLRGKEIGKIIMDELLPKPIAPAVPERGPEWGSW